MAQVTGMGTTFNLPNYHGELFLVTPTATPLLSLVGGVGGGKQTSATSFEWQAEDLRAPDSRPRLEGANAPDAEARSRQNLENVLQIFHERVTTSYTKGAATQAYAGSVPDPTAGTGEDVSYTTNDGSPNPVTAEHAHQINLTLKQIARDLNHVFWNGSYVKPDDDATPRETRGLLEAITDGMSVDGSPTANVVAAGATDLSADLLGELLQMVWDNGGIAEEETATLFVPSFQKRQLTTAYATANTDLYQGTRNVGGLDLQTIHTDFGTLNIVVDRMLPADTVSVVSLDQVDPVFLSIPGKGVLFEEELAKTGSADDTQIYGEIGLKYGNPLTHGVITGLTTS